MLYIQFSIADTAKFEDFQKLYKHMVKTREPGFDFQEDESAPEIDWDSKKNQEEIDLAVKELSDYLDQKPEFHRYHEKIPSYANDFLVRYLQLERDRLGQLGEQNPVSIFNYLECGFEVDMDSLEKKNKNSGVVSFSTGNYPFGGLERFILTLKAFALTPTECYDGFARKKINWQTDFEYEEIEIPKRKKGFFSFLNVIKRG